MSKPATLGRTQAQSLVVTVVANALTAAQGLLVLIFLSPREVGLLGIATGIGSLALVAQQFGLGAATLKEVSIAESRGGAYQTMLAGLLLRLVMTLPISLALIALSGFLAEDVYDHPAIRGPLILFAAIILLYGILDVLAYTLQGLHLWRPFFAQKLIGAILTTGIVLAATAAFGLDGYFIGLLGAAGAAVLVAGAYVAAAFGRRRSAGAAELWRHARAMFGLGAAAYAAKIFQVVALQAPILVAGYEESADDTGSLKVALTIGAIVLALSGAINTVNIAVFSRRVARADAGAHADARRQIGLYAALSAGLGAIVSTIGPDAVGILGHHYADAGPAIVWGAVGAALFGMLGIIVSTVYVPIGAYGYYVLAFLIPAVGASGAAVIAAAQDAGIAAYAAAFAVGAGVGVALVFADLARRSFLPFQALLAVATMAAVAVAGLAGVGDLVRYGVLAAALVVSGLLVKSLQAAPGRAEA